ncbi:MAG: PHP domain-containing protein [Firmicutes bacterium]|nr:PHP domain-containing protein [Bacillota bacterium]
MIAYDFHIHSCLSPAADDEMTPVKIIDQAVANGLDIIAITDTNSARNAAAAAEYAEGKIAFVPGIEVESSEEVHVVCLFPDVYSVSRMQRIVAANMYDKENRPEKFGNQLIVDEYDEHVDTEKRMLRYRTKMTIEEIFYAARQMGGAAFYAHLEQKAYSVLSVLGMIPQRPQPKAIEYTNNAAGRAMFEKKGDFGRLVFFNSDAFSLSQISTRENAGDLEAVAADLAGASGGITARAFIDWLREQPGI